MSLLSICGNPLMHCLRTLLLCVLTAGIAWTQPSAAPERADVEASVSGAVINDIVRRPIERIMPHQHNILGTEYYGESLSRGQIHAELVPDAARASINLVASGNTYSNVIGWKGSFIAY